ncbi:MAG: tetratricopeptide repeat protein [Acidobacteria bacterium]|nr:tetratricopeptide repeat protein [Acidobacteriota bacterium]
MSDRVSMLKALLEEDPANKFARYGLAMEYAKAGQLDTAVSEFRALIAADPSYCAAYFHGGQALEKAGEVEEARTMYEQGIEAAERAGDAHTRSELQGALDLLPL